MEENPYKAPLLIEICAAPEPGWPRWRVAFLLLLVVAGAALAFLPLVTVFAIAVGFPPFVVKETMECANNVISTAMMIGAAGAGLSNPLLKLHHVLSERRRAA